MKEEGLKVGGIMVSNPCGPRMHGGGHLSHAQLLAA